jgi:hypothetical protein
MGIMCGGIWSGPNGSESRKRWPLSGILGARPLKFTRLSGVPSDCPVRQRATVNFAQRSTARTVWSVRSQKTVCDDRSHQTVWCSKRTNDSKPQRPADVARTGLWTVMCPIHHRTVWCPSTTTAEIVVGAINTPNHHHSSHPSISLSSFNTRAKNTLQRHIQNLQSSLSYKIKSSDQECLVTWERVTCVFFVVWLLSSSHSNISKCFVKQARDT